MKRVFLSLITIFMVLSLSIVLVKAEGETISIDLIDGVQIRTDANAGLKWVAKLENPNADYEYGFLFAQGEVANLDKDTLNVEKYVVEGVTADSTTIAATMTKFPKAAVAKDITVRAYFKNENDEYTYSNIVVRNLAEVAVYAKNSLDGTFVNAVVEYVSANYKKVYTDTQNCLHVNSVVYESNSVILAKEFINDVNKFFDLELDPATAFDGNNGQQPLAKALCDITAKAAVLDTNVFKFFENEAMRTKWGWLLDVVKKETDIDTAKWGNGKPAIDALIANDAATAGEKWYGGCYPVSSILSLLAGQYESTGYGGYDIASHVEVLSTFIEYNKSIYADLSNAEIVKIGEKINLPKVLIKDYYDWVGYTADVLYEAEAEYTVTNTDLQFVPTFTPTQYTIKFYDGKNEITELALTYDIEDKDIELPSYVKDNHIFNGWYIDEECSGEKVEKVAAGSNGNKAFYAKTTEILGYSITYNFNGGNTKYASYDAVTDDLLADYNATASDAGCPYTKENLPTGNYKLISSGYAKFTTLSVEGVKMSVKWDWLSKYFIGVTTSENGAGSSTIKGVGQILDYENLSSKSDCQYGTSYTFRAFILETQLRASDASWASANFSDAEIQMQYLTYLSAAEQTEFINLNGTTTLLSTVYKEGYTFAGWYTSADFSGERVYTVSEACTLYAKWEPNVQ